jgi:probable HAF family extracellular repeat protein
MTKRKAAGSSGLCRIRRSLRCRLVPTPSLWDGDGAPHNLGNLGAAIVNAALGINNRGKVVGASSLQSDSTQFYKTDSFLWTRERGMVDLGTLPGDVASGGLAINDDGEIVGVSIDSSGNPSPISWHNADPVDMNTQVPSDSTMYLVWAQAINHHRDCGLGRGQSHPGHSHLSGHSLSVHG